MKTLDDAIEASLKDFRCLRKYSKNKKQIYGLCEENLIDSIRIACKAMAKEIVPEEELIDRILHNYTKPELDKKDAWNSCRDEILKNIERFMDGIAKK